MDRTFLFQESFDLFLETRDDRPFLFVERGQPGKVSEERLIAQFPVEISLLRATLSGFTYQVANQFGSLNVSKDGQSIFIAIQLISKERLTARVVSENFSDSLESFGS